jgi:ABC-type multidrug transport system ATPase subunit
VRPGIVTGFLGPNGSGKSTTMRLILGLDRPTSGDVTVNGKHYREHAAPLHEVGALLEARSVHTGRSAYNHLLALAQTHGIRRRRVDELIDLVGLRDVARKRAGQFSLGMGQRLGIASALLGDPSTVMLDEPVNGLNPEGIRWMRDLLKWPEQADDRSGRPLPDDAPPHAPTHALPPIERRSSPRSPDTARRPARVVVALPGGRRASAMSGTVVRF